MASPILKRTSFGLLRTNPKLTTNIKLIVDSKNKLYLESIDASPELAKSMFKGFEINPYGSYSYDIKRFYHQFQDQLPEDVAYFLFEEDAGLDIKKEYNKQYDLTYAYGFSTKDSTYYSEEYSIFAPIWLEKDNVPEYFVIFKIDGPSTVNINDPSIISTVGSTANFDMDPKLDDLVKNPSLFNSNFIKKSKIVKAVDLSQRTAIGKYIRNHVDDSLFPESSLFISLQKESNTYWNGISYKNGGFCSIGKDIYNDYILSDSTMLQSDDYITNGFKTNSVICANILNLEFLFDDINQNTFEFSRYYGLYMSEVELGKFILDKKRLSADIGNESTQTPYPFDDDLGDCFSEKSQIQKNPSGIKIYPKIGPSGPFSGRLLSWNEVQNPRFSYVKDCKGNFYSINSNNTWEINSTDINGNIVTDSNFLRISNTTIDWKNFTGMQIPFRQIPVKTTDSLGRSSASFKVLFTPNTNDEIRLKFTNWNDAEEKILIDAFTLKVDSDLNPGKSNQRFFSNRGTNKQIAAAISSAINNLSTYTDDYQIFTSISIEDEVFLYTRTYSENWNELKFSIFSVAAEFPYDITSDEFSNSKIKYIYNYTYSPVAELSIDKGWYYESFFTGGNTNPKSRLIISKEFIQNFRDPIEDVYVNTTHGYKRVNQSLYLDNFTESKGNITSFEDTDIYTIIEIEDHEGEFIYSYDNTIALYKLAKNTNGYFSIFPIKEFDFDYDSTEYNRPIDTDPKKLYQWYQGIGTTFGNPVFNWSSLNDKSKNFITNILGPTTAYNDISKFQYTIGYEDTINDIIYPTINEYDRLKENYINELSLTSRVVPFINKWVYDNNSVDVRENPYRLNTNTAFGFTNFSPSFDQILRSPKFFTHEWYYLQKYPPYMTFEEKLNSFSYFDEDLNFPIMPKYVDPQNKKYAEANEPEVELAKDINYVKSLMDSLVSATGPSANLYSIKEDYFTSYFTRETIGGSAIPRDFKYAIFENGTSKSEAETLFRGIKVKILERFENSTINYNKEKLRYIYSDRFNGYKFSAVLTYGNSGTKLSFVKNDKFKAVTLVIQADFNDILNQYTFGGKTYNFIDRSLLYTLEDKFVLSAGQFLYQDRVMSGKIVDWVIETNTAQGTYWRVYLGNDSIGNKPKVNAELRYNEFGSYNNIRVIDPVSGGSIRFEKIFDVDSYSFKCRNIFGGSTSSSLPHAAGTLSYLKYNVGSAWFGQVKAKSKPLDFNPVQILGGYDAYEDILQAISFSTLALDINAGDPDIDYININEEGLVEYNKYVINLEVPDYPMITQYLRPVGIKNSSYNNTQQKYMGYKIEFEERIKLFPIARYKGNYNPKTRDIFKFIDTQDLKNEGLNYYNIQILTDLGYIKDNKIGTIQNMYYNKVNLTNQKIIGPNTNSPIYIDDIFSAIGETNIGKKDHFVFRSNWDPYYYNRFNEKDIAEPVMGTREVKEEKAFFASKTLSIPNTVNIQTFGGIATLDELNSAKSIEALNKFYSDISKTLVYQQTNIGGSYQLNIQVFLEMEMIRKFLNDGIHKSFSTYINGNYSYGNKNKWDDVIQYIKTNIYQRYKISNITLWEKKIKLAKGEASNLQIVTNLEDDEKFEQGYKQTSNFVIKKLSQADLNFNLIYNLQTNTKTSIAISVEIQKK